MDAVRRVLFGALEKDYDFGKREQAGSCGISYCWRIYGAVKRSTNEKCSVLILEKSRLRRLKKEDQEMFFELLRGEAHTLYRLRHPCILRVLTPMIETKNVISLVTEPVTCSLGNAVGVRDNLAITPRGMGEVHFSALEVRVAMVDLMQGLSFCHHDANLCHLNLCPENVMLTSDGAWKLSGFAFSHNMKKVLKSVFVPGYCASFRTAPDLDYAAPELFRQSDEVGPAADMFSLGCLAYRVVAERPLIESKQDLKQQKAEIDRICEADFSSMSDEMRALICSLTCVEPDRRMTVRATLECELFHGKAIQCVRFLSNFMAKERGARVQFMRGFLNILPELDLRVIHSKVIPPLKVEMETPSLVPLVLPIFFEIARQENRQDFERFLLPSFLGACKIKEPPQVRVMLLRNFDLIYDKCPRHLFKEVFLPMVYAAVNSNVPAIQEEALYQCSQVVKHLDYAVLKQELYPRTRGLVESTELLAVRVAGLFLISRMTGFLSREAVVDLLGVLRNVMKRDQRPATIMAILGVCDEYSKAFGPEITATHLLPFVIPLFACLSLNPIQLETLGTVAREMLCRIEASKVRRKKRRGDPEVGELVGGMEEIEDESDNIFGDGGVRRGDGGRPEEAGGARDLFKFDAVWEAQQRRQEQRASKARAQEVAEPMPELQKEVYVRVVRDEDQYESERTRRSSGAALAQTAASAAVDREEPRQRPRDLAETRWWEKKEEGESVHRHAGEGEVEAEDVGDNPFLVKNRTGFHVRSEQYNPDVDDSSLDRSHVDAIQEFRGKENDTIQAREARRREEYARAERMREFEERETQRRTEREARELLDTQEARMVEELRFQQEEEQAREERRRRLEEERQRDEELRRKEEERRQEERRKSLNQLRAQPALQEASFIAGLTSLVPSTSSSAPLDPLEGPGSSLPLPRTIAEQLARPTLLRAQPRSQGRSMFQMAEKAKEQQTAEQKQAEDAQTQQPREGHGDAFFGLDVSLAPPVVVAPSAAAAAQPMSANANLLSRSLGTPTTPSGISVSPVSPGTAAGMGFGGMQSAQPIQNMQPDLFDGIEENPHAPVISSGVTVENARMGKGPAYVSSPFDHVRTAAKPLIPVAAEMSSSVVPVIPLKASRAPRPGPAPDLFDSELFDYNQPASSSIDALHAMSLGRPKSPEEDLLGL